MSYEPGQSQYTSPAQATNTMAIISVVSGALSWFLLPFIGAVVAIVTGHMARNEIKKSQGLQGGDGLALIGLVLGYLNLVGFCASILLFLLFFGGIIGLSGCAILADPSQFDASSIVIPPLPAG